VDSCDLIFSRPRRKRQRGSSVLDAPTISYVEQSQLLEKLESCGSGETFSQNQPARAGYVVQYLAGKSCSAGLYPYIKTASARRCGSNKTKKEVGFYGKN
jgi:hypothetical protein